MPTTKTISAQNLSNVDLWNALRQNNPAFAAMAPEATVDTFTERGFGELVKKDGLIDEFWRLSVPYFFDRVDSARCKDLLESQGFGDYVDVPWGGYIQRIATQSVLKPINPRYKDLKNGTSVDQFTVRRIEATERFFTFNKSYQNFATYPDSYETKQIFMAENGVSLFIAGLKMAMENGYTIDKYNMKLECLNAMINNKEHPVKHTQKINVKLSANPTEQELLDFILALKDKKTEMDTTIMTGAYNALNYENMPDSSSMTLLLRPGIKNRIEMLVKRNSRNEQFGTDIPFKIIEIPHFGGLQPFKEPEFTTPLFRVTNSIGEEIGFNEQEGQSVVTVENDKVFWKDPNINTVGILADNKIIFEMSQNPMEISTVRNSMGKYTNFIASRPNYGICYDLLYNFLVIEKTA